MPETHTHTERERDRERQREIQRETEIKRDKSTHPRTHAHTPEPGRQGGPGRQKRRQQEYVKSLQVRSAPTTADKAENNLRQEKRAREIHRRGPKANSLEALPLHAALLVHDCRVKFHRCHAAMLPVDTRERVVPVARRVLVSTRLMCEEAP